LVSPIFRNILLLDNDASILT